MTGCGDVGSLTPSLELRTAPLAADQLTVPSPGGSICPGTGESRVCPGGWCV